MRGGLDWDCFRGGLCLCECGESGMVSAEMGVESDKVVSATASLEEGRTIEELAIYKPKSGGDKNTSRSGGGRTIWTKDPHGGAYKVSKQNVDPMKAQLGERLRRQQEELIRQNGDVYHNNDGVMISCNASQCEGDKKIATRQQVVLPPQPDIGYEDVEKGPTSNFVGNHMTQGAVDLIQYQLRR